MVLLWSCTGCFEDLMAINISGPDEVEVDGIIQLAASLVVKGEEIPGQHFKWISSDETVATVAKGVVTALTPGKVTITASRYGIEGTKEIRVKRIIPDNTVVIYYFRYPEEDPYDGWGLHLWWKNQSDSTEEGYVRQDGTAVEWSNPFMWQEIGQYQTGVESYEGAVYEIAIPDEYQDAHDLWFIVHQGDNKDTADNRSLPDLTKKEYWLLQNDATIHTSAPSEDYMNIRSGELLSSEEIKVRFMNTGLLKEDGLSIKSNTGDALSISDITITDEEYVVVEGDFDFAQAPFTIEYYGRMFVVNVPTDKIDAEYYYDGDDLGATYDDGSVTLKLWSPLASEIVAYFYDKDDQTVEIGSKAMTREDKGVWTLGVNAEDFTGVTDLEGYFYQYEITVAGKTTRALDPYARSMAEFTVDSEGNGGTGSDIIGKAAIIDLATTTPVSGYADISDYSKREDAIIWEMHVRDFTSDPYIEGSLAGEPFGTYTAFIEKLDYLQELGITHIQLMPVMNYYYGDESKRGEREAGYQVNNCNYNWGYDPHSYFTPEGMYSSDPTQPKQRVNELKKLIEAIHARGMGVTLDVVYNHTANTSVFENIVPDYYYRLDDSGNFTGNSGCGNDMATTHKMVRKLIVDSTSYWVREYKVDGFRFDLMGLIDRETIQEAYDECAAINPNVLFVGEGWFMYNGSEGTDGADQGWQTTNNDIVSMFCDDFRDILKGGGLDEDNLGFLEGEAVSIDVLFNNIKAIVTQEQSRLDSDENTPFTSDDPGDVLQYIAAHDNLCLHDKMHYNLNYDINNDADKPELYQRLKLGNFMILTSQGLSFLHGGQEMGRTKWFDMTGITEEPTSDVAKNDTTGLIFVSNSYDASDSVNRFDWQRVTEDVYSQDLIAYTRGLISLRKSTDAFHLPDHETINNNIDLLSTEDTTEDDLVIAYSVQSTSGEKYYVFVNAYASTDKVFSVPADLSLATVLVDSDEATLDGVTALTGVTISSTTVTVAPLTAIVIKE
jgi:pullulanase